MDVKSFLRQFINLGEEGGFYSPQKIFLLILIFLTFLALILWPIKTQLVIFFSVFFLIPLWIIYTLLYIS
jgi:hypothetical protein